MLSTLFLFVSALAMSGAPPEQSVQTRNGEFIFSQYPPRAKAAGEQGAVRFRAEVDAKGNVMSCKVIGSSGYRRLDDETCEMIIDHATFTATLDTDGKAREAVHEGIVNWRIPGAPAATKVAASGSRSPDEVVCKRIGKTGSLVTHSRLCMTRREWIAYAEHNQDEWGSMQGRQGSSREDQPTWTGGQ